jgi:hypothetical protein
MPLTAAPANPLPFFWTFYGHSYWQGSYGAHGPAGRADSIMRSLFSLEQVSATKNHAVVGAKLTWTGLSQGGWVRLMQYEQGNTVNPAAPDIAYDGAFFLGWSINDIGGNGNTAQLNTCYQHALRACISRCRCSRSWVGTDAAFTAGAGFVNQAFTWETAPGNNYYSATATTNATLSWAVPADFKGGVITFLFLAQPGVKGATFTWGGTAGVTGTTSTSNITPAGFPGGRVPVVRRITNLTAANAGQTITLTVTAIDAGGTADFAGAWIESPWPPPVLAANAPRLNALGYSVYAGTYTATGLSGTTVAATPATITLASGTTYGLPTAGSMTIPSTGGTVTISWTGGPGSASTTTLTGVTHSGGSGTYSSNTMSWAGPVDADVIAFNTVLDSLFSEFDGMVQLVDLDVAIAKDALALGSDGLHPSELGAARIADTFRVAAQRLAPSSAYGEASQMNVPNRALVPLYTPRVSNGWYTTPGAVIGGTPYTPVAGDMFAIPINCASQGETWFQWSVETLGGTVAATVEMAIYDDRGTSGLPKHLYINPSTGPITLPVGAAVYNSPTSPGNGYLVVGPDPGLYWLSLLIVSAGTGVTFRTVKGPTPLMPNLAAGGGGGSTAVGWKMTGKSAPMPPSWDFPFTPGLDTYVDNCPLIGVKVF